MQVIGYDTSQRVAVAGIIATNRGQTYNTPNNNYWDISALSTSQNTSDSSLLTAQDNWGTGIRCVVSGKVQVVAKFREVTGTGIPLAPLVCTLRVGGVDQMLNEVEVRKEWSYTDAFHVNAGQWVQFYSYDSFTVQEIQMTVFFIAD